MVSPTTTPAEQLPLTEQGRLACRLLVAWARTGWGAGTGWANCLSSFDLISWLWVKTWNSLVVGHSVHFRCSTKAIVYHVLAVAAVCFPCSHSADKWELACWLHYSVTYNQLWEPYLPPMQRWYPFVGLCNDFECWKLQDIILVFWTCQFLTWKNMLKHVL